MTSKQQPGREQLSRELGSGIAALVVTAVEVGHGELEARRQVAGFLRGLRLDPGAVLRAAIAGVAGLAPAETVESDEAPGVEDQLLAALEAREWLERMAADVAQDRPVWPLG
ncbi:hypothetical protein [Kineococcus rhizosphaerae]|uniref:Uncharacterized protein n=1 Tax=Kineococcus rhizosphaerae TaxID=559628 RepID=A0A2T0R9V1_9ACTN|nr:hypothetical protein [Kineococcus rhizosphaerae]PRY17933.1 hypothetical protein CLV37_101175 [Kineococcus rhizosphaerae]